MYKSECSSTVVYYMYTYVNHTIQIHRRDSNTQVDSFASGMNVLLLTSEFGSSTRERETILKSLSYHTMLKTPFKGRNPSLCPNGRNSTIVFHGPISNSQLPGRTPTSQHNRQNSTCQHQGRTPTVSISWSELNFNCLPQWQTTQLSAYIVPSQLLIDVFFKIFKFSGPLLPGIMSFTLQPRFLSGVYYDNCDCHILCT